MKETVLPSTEDTIEVPNINFLSRDLRIFHLETNKRCFIDYKDQYFFFMPGKENECEMK